MVKEKDKTKLMEKKIRKVLRTMKQDNYIDAYGERNRYSNNPPKEGLITEFIAKKME